MKFRPLGAELSHAERQTDGQTDMTKLIVAFRNFTNASKKLTVHEITTTIHVHSNICSVLRRVIWFQVTA